jgi:hypothetical protein
VVAIDICGGSVQGTLQHTRLVNGAGWQLSVAVAINNNDQILGNGFYNGQPRAFLLLPWLYPWVVLDCGVCSSECSTAQRQWFKSQRLQLNSLLDRLKQAFITIVRSIPPGIAAKPIMFLNLILTSTEVLQQISVAVDGIRKSYRNQDPDTLVASVAVVIADSIRMSWHARGALFDAQYLRDLYQKAPTIDRVEEWRKSIFEQ